jgi:hypothetical protein
MRPVWFNSDRISPAFSPDVDNICGLAQVDSFIVTPIFSNDNQLLGMI